MDQVDETFGADMGLVPTSKRAQYAGVSRDTIYTACAASATVNHTFMATSRRAHTSLEGYAHHVDALFAALPPTWIVLDSYVRFLYHIGERSLHEAFVRVADSLKGGDAQAMLQKTNTVFLLEVLLQRHVYGRPLEPRNRRYRPGLQQSSGEHATVALLLNEWDEEFDPAGNESV